MKFVFDETLGFLVNRCGILMREELQQRFKFNGFDITSEEWALLGALESQGQMSVSKLAKLTLKDRTTVTRFADRLVDKGLIERTKDRDDLRTTYLTLTKTGEKVITQLIEIVKGFLVEVQTAVPKPELEATKSALSRICNLLTERS